MSNFDQFIKSLQIVKLHPEAKLAMRKKLVAQIASNPLSSPKVSSWNYFQWRLVVMPLVAVLVCGSAVSLAAERSLPGQFLYSVKLGLNEPVSRFFRVSKTNQDAILNYETSLLNKRLEEAEQLDQLNKLNDSTKATVREAIVRQQEKVSQSLRGRSVGALSATAPLKVEGQTEVRSDVGVAVSPATDEGPAGTSAQGWVSGVVEQSTETGSDAQAKLAVPALHTTVSQLEAVTAASSSTPVAGPDQPPSTETEPPLLESGRPSVNGVSGDLELNVRKEESAKSDLDRLLQGHRQILDKLELPITDN